MTSDPFEIELQQLVGELSHSLQTRGRRLCSAESCTGGWIAKAMTDRAGSSSVFECGFVTYSNEAKKQMLGVSDASLQREGAVSDSVVREMAMGALERSGADFSVAVSGVAGPSGGSTEKPVGTVWFAWGMRMKGKSSQGNKEGEDRKIESEKILFDGDRNHIRFQTVLHALRGVLARCER